MTEIGKIIWKTIPGTYGIYEVSNFGEIRNRLYGNRIFIKYGKHHGGDKNERN